MSVESRITEFATGKGTGAFPAISRADVITGLRERTNDPATIDQGRASLCGPASFLYCLLNDDPEVYVKYVIDLYNTGTAYIGTLKVSPGKDCRNYKPQGIAPIDWIALASLRDSENVFFDYEDTSDQFSGITLPMTLAGWFKAARYQDVKNETNVFFTKGGSDLDTYYALRLHQRKVCLFINADMLSSTKNKGGGVTTTPNHWIVLESCTGRRNDRLTATVWTWGGYQVVPPTGTLTSDQFCGNFFGYVSGRYPAK